jgi:hypothetical protein
MSSEGNYSKDNYYDADMSLYLVPRSASSAEG